jgi:HAD superfamily hydrolase (TIGR01509 family)
VCATAAHGKEQPPVGGRCGTVPALRPPVTTVLFDFAGTLFSPRPAIEWVSAAAVDCGITLTRHEIAALAAEYLAVGLPGGPYPTSVAPDLLDAYAQRDLSTAAHRAAYVGLLSTVAAPCEGLAEAIYTEVLRPQGWLPYRDAQRVVAALDARGIKLGVVSNVGFDLRPILWHHGFEVLAAHCTLSFEHGVAKPDPAIFEAALTGLQASPAETLMVGDHPVADAAAASVGCRTMLLPMSPPGATHGLEGVLRMVAPGQP